MKTVFFYDVVKLTNGQFQQLKVRSLQGLMPIFAVDTISSNWSNNMGNEFWDRIQWFVEMHPEILQQLTPRNVPQTETNDSITPPPLRSLMETSSKGDYLFALVSADKLRAILKRMLDENEFLGPHGIRSVSRFHLAEPVNTDILGTDYTMQYSPAESPVGISGGNSNWRGPVWFPINFLLIESLQKFDYFYGKDFVVECPTGSGKIMTLWEVAQEITRRLISTFERDANNRRPMYGGTQMFQNDPHWRDHLLFFEYFHGDNGAGLGASHQTGWTGLLAKLIQQATEHS